MPKESCHSRDAHGLSEEFPRLRGGEAGRHRRESRDEIHALICARTARARPPASACSHALLAGHQRDHHLQGAGHHPGLPADVALRGAGALVPDQRGLSLRTTAVENGAGSPCSASAGRSFVLLAQRPRVLRELDPRARPARPGGPGRLPRHALLPSCPAARERAARSPPRSRSGRS